MFQRIKDLYTDDKYHAIWWGRILRVAVIILGLAAILFPVRPLGALRTRAELPCGWKTWLPRRSKAPARERGREANVQWAGQIHAFVSLTLQTAGNFAVPL